LQAATYADLITGYETNSQVHLPVAYCFQGFQLNSMEEVVAAVAVEEEDIPLEVAHMVQDRVEAYPYVPSCEVVATWL
jgi:hypothetical protein